ncbi:MAG TPA: hypothetical protein EYP85_14065 [Armatimonadetes bacterium]|nr:hypothetical protein [Armatimonadota bacterium]
MSNLNRLATWADRLAFVLSAAASPYFIIPAFGLAVVWRYAPAWREFWVWGGIVLAFTTLLPFLYIALNVLGQRITDFHIMLREQRRGPFLVALASISAGTLLLQALEAPRELVALGLCLVGNGAVFTIITYRWKISLHPSVLAAAIVVATKFFGPGWAWLGLAVPPVVWARIRRRRHNLAQGLVAIALAVGLTLFILWGLKVGEEVTPTPAP